MKYRNQKIKIGNLSFDSKKEYRRYQQLSALQRMGAIKELVLQQAFKLLPNQPLKQPRKQKSGRYQRTEQGVSYIADFCYTDIKTGKFIVEDTKGFKTADYIIKRKLMKYIHDIEIVEL